MDDPWTGLGIGFVLLGIFGGMSILVWTLHKIDMRERER